jgi:hypothetical protein
MTDDATREWVRNLFTTDDDPEPAPATGQPEQNKSTHTAFLNRLFND